MKRTKNKKEKRIERFEIDFFKEFNLQKPTTGLVDKIISPKGTRKPSEDLKGHYLYKFQTDLSLPAVYEEKPMLLDAGLYKVLDICHIEDELVWNNYLFILEPNGSVYPIAEYLKQKDSSWVREALPLVKDYFNENFPEPIELTKFKRKKKNSSWKSSY